MDDDAIHSAMTAAGCGGTLTPAVRQFAEICAQNGAASERAAWVSALDAEMVCCHLGVFIPGTHSPRECINRLLAFHQELAVDPAVSHEAQTLIDRGATEERARQLDCRTCRQHNDRVGGCMSVVRCIDGSAYQRAGVRQCWASGV